MFVKTESGLYRPRTTEDDRELEMNLLSIDPLCKADYISSISQVLSPRRGKELISLAKIIRDTVEPYVRTAISNDADYHPHIQASLKVELMYAYALLHAGEQDRKKRSDYYEEARRLDREVTSSSNDKDLFEHAAIAYTMRSATWFYFNAAWNFLNKGKQSITNSNLNSALQYYSDVKKRLVVMCSEQPRKFAKHVKQYGIKKIPEIVQLSIDSGSLKFDKESIEEFITMLVSDQFENLMQDVLFGEMRCYALQGKNRKFKKVSKELTTNVQDPRIKPAQIITESYVRMMNDAEKNSRWKGLKLNPFVSDSPEIVLRAVKHIEESFGEVSSRPWKPRDRLESLVTLLV